MNFFWFTLSLVGLSILGLILFQDVLRASGWIFLVPFFWGVGMGLITDHFAGNASHPWIYIVLGASFSFSPEHTVLALKSAGLRPQGRHALAFASLIIYGIVMVGIHLFR